MYAMQTIFVCKLYKLQSESLDQHPKGMEDWVILQSGPALGLGNHTFANLPPTYLRPSSWMLI